MENLTESTNTDPNNEEVNFEPEGDSLVEQLLRTVVLGYKEQFNKHNEKFEVDFSLTITNHKVALPEGNKNVSYLRLDRAVRSKINPDTNLPWVSKEDGWDSKLLHQEVYFFKNTHERLNPKAPWKEQLYLNCLARLTAAGLEYAELLQRLKKVEDTTPPQEDVKERAANIGLEVTSEMPKAMSPEDLKYKEWLANERRKEGL